MREQATRRAVLASFAAVPVLGIAATAAAPLSVDDRAWNAARARLIAAELAAEHEESDEAITAVGDANSALMETPAPHLAALRWKLEDMIWEDGRGEVHMDSFFPETAAVILADVRRLLPEA